ncbi:hypothetical protein RRG08_034354 [Elysia crispata]|uniref:Uncharacterized protein n=1 Tax=Elysia crispata TaxID=231223 RepID=A0AAE0YCS9_9GAST|nr:hypothetical protein RRG08_034354 [Elysia crispata]
MRWPQDGDTSKPVPARHCLPPRPDSGRDLSTAINVYGFEVCLRVEFLKNQSSFVCSRLFVRREFREFKVCGALQAVM